MDILCIHIHIYYTWKNFKNDINQKKIFLLIWWIFPCLILEIYMYIYPYIIPDKKAMLLFFAYVVRYTVSINYVLFFNILFHNKFHFFLENSEKIPPFWGRFNMKNTINMGENIKFFSPRILSKEIIHSFPLSILFALMGLPHSGFPFASK